MVDPKKELLEGQVRDLGDATYGGRSGTRVRAGNHKDAGQADVIVITAGAKQKEGLCKSSSTFETMSRVTNNIKKKGESRMDLLSRNLKILSSIFEPMKPIATTTVILLVANPVDILTQFARKMSGLPENQVLGTGTSLDSARLRGEIAKRAEVAASSIDAYVLGEHGEGQFVSYDSFLMFGDFNTACVVCNDEISVSHQYRELSKGLIHILFYSTTSVSNSRKNRSPGPQPQSAQHPSPSPSQTAH